MPENVDIAQWLEGLGFGGYVETFARNHVGLEDLATLTSEDLKEIGVASFGHRRMLLAEIQKLAASPEVPDSEPQPSTTPPEIAAPPAEPPPAPAPAPVVEAKPAEVVAERSVAPPPPLPERAAPVATSAAVVAPETATPDSSPVTKRTGFWTKLLARKFLLVSIVLHLLFGMGATYFIVQKVQAKRKVTFQGGPPAVNPSKRALEHKVSMAQKKKTGGAPPQPKRIVSAGLAKVSLPDLPSVPTTTSVPGMAVGMGGAGFGTGMGFGSGAGGGMGGGGGGGGGMTMFGVRGGSPGLVGRFYDLKQTSSGSRTKIQDIATYLEEANRFLRGGWSEGALNKYFVAPNRLNCRQLFVPRIASQTAPEAYEVEKQVKANENGLTLWLAHYKAQVSPPESGIYHFVGGGDAILAVRINRATVLHKSWNYNETPQLDPNWHPVARYDYQFPAAPHTIPGGLSKGQGVDLKAGVWYDMEVLIGDDGGMCNFTLLVEKEGVQYQKTPAGLPILPLFRTAKDKIAPGEHPPFQDNGPIWQARAVLGWR